MLVGRGIFGDSLPLGAPSRLSATRPRRGGKHVHRGLHCWRFAPVAQGIEQRFPKPRVGGSNPSRRAPEDTANREKAKISGFASALYYTNYCTNADNSVTHGVMNRQGRALIPPEVSRELLMYGILGSSTIPRAPWSRNWERTCLKAWRRGRWRRRPTPSTWCRPRPVPASGKRCCRNRP